MIVFLSEAGLFFARLLAAPQNSWSLLLSKPALPADKADELAGTGNFIEDYLPARGVFLRCLAGDRTEPARPAEISSKSATLAGIAYEACCNSGAFMQLCWCCHQRVRKQFFFEKKNQKTFGILRDLWESPKRARGRVNTRCEA